MKKVLLITLALLMMAVPAYAEIKQLDAQVAAELEGLVKQAVATEMKVEASKVSVSEAWLRELKHIGAEVYIVVTSVNDQKITDYVQVSDKQLLTEEEFNNLVAQDEQESSKNPVFSTTAIAAPEIGQPEVDEQGRNYTPYYIGGGIVLALGAGALVIRRKVA